MPKGIYNRKPMSEEHKKAISISHVKNEVGKWNKGIVRTDEFKSKVSEKLKGRKPSGAAIVKDQESPNWNENVGYRGLHHWIARKLGKANLCTHCGKNGTGHEIHWANISREYKRELTDWMQLCVKCHKTYDSIN